MESDFLCTQAIADLDETYNDENEQDGDETKKEVAILKVLPNKKSGIPAMEFPIYHGENIIGRHTNCNISIPWSIALSKKHAVIEAESDTCFVSDCGSSNKTRLNKAKLKADVKYGLRDGDQLIFGDVQCTFMKKSVAELSEVSTFVEPSVNHSGANRQIPTSSTPANNKTRILATDTPENLMSISATVHATLNDSTATIPESQPMSADTPLSVISKRLQDVGNGKVSTSTKSSLPIFRLDETIENDQVQTNERPIATSSGDNNISHITATDDSDADTDYHENSDTDIEDKKNTTSHVVFKTDDSEFDDIYGADTIELTSGKSSQVSTDVNDPNTGADKLNVNDLSNSDTEDYELSMIKNLNSLQTQMFAMPKEKDETPEEKPTTSTKIENPNQATHSSDTDDEAILSVDLESIASENLDETKEGTIAFQEDSHGEGCSKYATKDVDYEDSPSIGHDAFDDFCTQGFSGMTSRGDHMEDTLGMLETQAFGVNLGNLPEENDEGDDEVEIEDSMIFNMPTQAFPGCMNSPKSATKLSLSEKDIPKQENMPNIGDSIEQEAGESTIPLTEKSVNIHRIDNSGESVESHSLFLQISTVSANENSGFSEFVHNPEQYIASSNDQNESDTERFDTIPLIAENKNVQQNQNDDEDTTPPLVRSREATFDPLMHQSNLDLKLVSTNTLINSDDTLCSVPENEKGSSSPNGPTGVRMNSDENSVDKEFESSASSLRKKHRGNSLSEVVSHEEITRDKVTPKQDEMDDQETQVYDLDDINQQTINKNSECDKINNDEIRQPSGEMEEEDAEETQIYEMDVEELCDTSTPAPDGMKLNNQENEKMVEHLKPCEEVKAPVETSSESTQNSEVNTREINQKSELTPQSLQNNFSYQTEGSVMDENKNLIKTNSSHTIKEPESSTFNKLTHCEEISATSSSNQHHGKSSEIASTSKVVEDMDATQSYEYSPLQNKVSNEGDLEATQAYVKVPQQCEKSFSSISDENVEGSKHAENYTRIKMKESNNTDMMETQSYIANHSIVNVNVENNSTDKNIDSMSDFEATQKYIKLNTVGKSETSFTAKVDEISNMPQSNQVIDVAAELFTEVKNEMQEPLEATALRNIESKLSKTSQNKKIHSKNLKKDNMDASTSSTTSNIPAEPVRKSRRTSRKDYANLAKGIEDSDNKDTPSSSKNVKQIEKANTSKKSQSELLTPTSSTKEHVDKSSRAISEDDVTNKRRNTRNNKNNRSLKKEEMEINSKTDEPKCVAIRDNAQTFLNVDEPSTSHVKTRKINPKAITVDSKTNTLPSISSASKVDTKKSTRRSTRSKTAKYDVEKENKENDNMINVDVEENETTEDYIFKPTTSKSTRGTRASRSKKVVNVETTTSTSTASITSATTSATRRISSRAKKKQELVEVKQKTPVMNNDDTESNASEASSQPESIKSKKSVVNGRKRRNASVSSTSSTTSTARSAMKTPAKKIKSEDGSVDTALQHAVAMALRPKRSKPKVMFTGVLDSVAEGIVVSLGGTLATDISECTHLVTDKMRRTIKFLCAVTRGLHIVTLEWLHMSIQHKRFLPEEEFELKEDFRLPSGEFLQEKYKFNLKDTLNKARESETPLFHYFNIFVTRNVAPPPDQMHQVLKCAGASILSRMPGSGRAEITPNTVIIATPGDKKSCANAIKAGCHVVTNEFVLTGIVRHSVDFGEHELFDSCSNSNAFILSTKSENTESSALKINSKSKNKRISNGNGETSTVSSHSSQSDVANTSTTERRSSRRAKKKVLS